jgi:predicted alpha/beta-fold hydrolase
MASKARPTRSTSSATPTSCGAPGANVIRMNMRNCGGRTTRWRGSRPRSTTPGLSGDVGAVMRFFLERERLESIALVGYSMGGNLVLKLAGELGADARPTAFGGRRLARRSTSGHPPTALHRPQNRSTSGDSCAHLLNASAQGALFPRAFDPNRATGIRSLREFDDRITALYSGFLSAEDYYFSAPPPRASSTASPCPPWSCTRSTIPFVHITPETLAKLEANPHITLLQTEHGGHCAFLAKPRPGRRRRRILGRNHPPPLHPRPRLSAWACLR